MTSLMSKVKVTRYKKCAVHSHQAPAAMEWTALTAHNIMHEQTGLFCCCRRVFSAACARFMFGKTSLALVSVYIYCLILYYISHY